LLQPEEYQKLYALADEVSRREGCVLYDLEFHNNPKNRVLRVYIESESEAVSVEQCANVSRGLSLLLDVEDYIPGGAYELEVSSPGLERQLRQPWHYQKSVGKEVKLITHEPIIGLKGEVKSLTGEISSVKGEDAVVVAHESYGLVEVPFQNIKRAQVIFKFKKNEKK